MSAASIAFAVTRACSKGELNECACDNRVRQRKPRTWQWGGCSEDIRHGEKVSREFLDVREDPNTAVGLMNLHNNEAGRRVNPLVMTMVIDFLIIYFVEYQIENAAGMQVPRNVGIV